MYPTSIKDRRNGAKLESHGASGYSSDMAGDGDFRFPSSMRLKKKAEFVRVFRKGAVWKGSYFSLHILPRAEDALLQQEGPRLGMVVTRKVGSAVERNRVKRRIRESFRKMAHSMPAVDLVIRPNAACTEISEALITRSLRKAVKCALESVKEKT